MAPNRVLLIALATFALAALAAAGCGTEASGVSDCQDIEFVRCEAGAYCATLLGNERFRNVSACRRFQRDHCLHGLGVSDVSAVQVDACVATLRSAGECARDVGPGAEPRRCSAAVPLARSAGSICDVILEPERAQACSFLVEEPGTPPVTPDGGAG